MKGTAADRRRELSAIHAAATKLGMDTADKDPSTEYRQLLHGLTGKTSASELDTGGRRAVIRRLQHLIGNQGKPKDGWHAEKMRQLWRQLGEHPGVLKDPTERGLVAFVKALTGKDALRFLPTRDGNKVVEALKAMLKRAGAAGA